jgi:hypothetical protein
VWTARSTAAQFSTDELNERSRAAVEQAMLVVEDTRILIADCETFAAKLNAWRLTREAVDERSLSM